MTKEDMNLIKMIASETGIDKIWAKHPYLSSDEEEEDKGTISGFCPNECIHVEIILNNQESDNIKDKDDLIADGKKDDMNKTNEMTDMINTDKDLLRRCDEVLQELKNEHEIRIGSDNGIKKYRH